MMFKTGVRVKLITTLMASLLVSGFTASAVMAVNEVSRLVPFQGRLHGTDNKAVSDGVYDLTFNIYDTPTGGTPSWSEAHTQVSVIHGYVNILLGAITPMHDNNYGEVTATPAYDPSKNNVDFTTKKFLGISINGGVEMFPRSQLVPSFHAFTANHADHASEADHAIEADHALQADQATNASNLNNQDASYYAKSSDLGSSNSRLTTIEGKFTGSKAKDADLLDGLSSGSFMRQVNTNGYYGLTPGGTSSTYVRTPQNGLLPYQSGGHGRIGTSSWPFSSIYGNDIYDNGTLLESKYLGIGSKAADSQKLDGIDSTGFMRSVAVDSHYRLTPNGSSSAWVRTTSNGIIPYTSGNNSSSLGTFGWAFANIHGTNIYDGGTLLESKYLGISATAANATKLANEPATDYARTDIAETFGSNVTINGDAYINGEDLYVGNNSGGDTEIHFYDDSNDTQRTIQWDDSANTFKFEDKAGNLNPFLQVRTGEFSLGTDDRHSVSFPVFPNNVLFVTVTRAIENPKIPVNIYDFENGKFWINRNNDIDGSDTITWFAIGY